MCILVHMANKTETKITPLDVKPGDTIYWYEFNSTKTTRKLIGGTVASIHDLGTGATFPTQHWLIKFEPGTEMAVGRYDKSQPLTAGTVWTSMHQRHCLPEIYRVAE